MTEDSEKPRPKRGLSALPPERMREIRSMGGKALPGKKRAFSKDRTLAAEAGRRGGKAVPTEKRSFSRDPELASKAGRKGGLARGRKKAELPEPE